MRNLLFVATMALVSCARTPAAPLAPLEQDESIVFPESFGAAPVVGRAGKPYSLEGVTLQALMVATQDFLAPGSKEAPCWSRPDAYVYQVLRQEDVIFIEIHADPAACEGQFLMLDSGIRYAVSVDGRILRRLRTGEPGGRSPAPTVIDAGVSSGTRELDLSGAVVAPPGTSAQGLPWRRQDGGVGDGGTPSLPKMDGGVTVPQ
ncbi:hypothetical protein [Hyalangium minutum]|uniref:Lipoprotein n=1 Tax=Hyalangium minutum TaxID=394096 RepID=A0A085VWG0_9BACT|nr:hypothetical protein [Hyalangium minutum]KFE59773.1 hypothetical protein DB31_6046 [Hyalangium minutum]